MNPSTLIVPALASLLLGGCFASQPQGRYVLVETPSDEPFPSTTTYKGPKATAPVPADVRRIMAEKGMTKSAPILIRIFKQEKQLEVWKRTTEGRYAVLKTYPICNYSGTLGPKKVTGDKQAPEGFYTVHPRQMNPNSQYYLSFDVGFPNQFDRTLGRTGSALMVHGGCLSAGCYAMGDDQIREIYALARDALAGGQNGFQVQALPFRMTDENMRKHVLNPNYAFWSNLKVGSDAFEATQKEVSVSVRKKVYAFNLPQPKEETTMFAGLENKDVPSVIALAPPRRF